MLAGIIFAQLLAKEHIHGKCRTLDNVIHNMSNDKFMKSWLSRETFNLSYKRCCAYNLLLQIPNHFFF